MSGSSEIERIIPPEIVNDDFHRLISRLARREKLKHVLEIGSSAGGGSTSAFVRALRNNPNAPNLYCMEVSKTRFEALSRRYAGEGFVKCFNVSSIPVAAFPSEAEVADFYQSTPTSLNKYPLEQVLGWLRQDIDYVQSAGVPQDGIAHVKRAAGVEHFDMVLIDGSEFTGAAELDQVYGATYILLDDTNAFKCHAARERLLADPDYDLIADNQALRNGFSAFKRRDINTAAPDLPIHFFTIVLNGEPFIRYHLDLFKKLPFRWHWHIVEGVASLAHDTAWSVAGGGRIDDTLHDAGRSNDGTSAYLDEIARANPESVTLYRKPPGQFWDGKREMVAAPLAHIQEECLLWQVDADELWTLAQIETMRARFLADPSRTAAKFWCHYFVGPEALISTRYNYAQNPDQEWLRVWRYLPGDRWAAHEPPTLVRRMKGGEKDLAGVAPFTHEETEAFGAVFQHYAYVTPAQLRFKETYYGYTDAEQHWRALQDAAPGGAFLKDYFPWVADETMVESAAKMGVAPIAHLAAGSWRFEEPKEAVKATKAFPSIVVDAAFFQHNQRSGIARVWRALLKEWLASGFAAHVTVIDRAGAAPRLPGLKYRAAPAWDEARTAEDSLRLQRICDEVGADLFISSYYTSPITTPSVFLAHDFIPERLGDAVDDQNWREKQYALEHAAFVICVSESTHRDLIEFYPRAGARSAVIANGLESVFAPPEASALAAFKTKHGLSRPYFLMVGDRRGYRGYKSGEDFFRAFRGWPARAPFDVLCVGGGPLESEFEALATGLTLHQIDLPDGEMPAAYAGAQALVYPSKLEGFGLPVAEAMACGCPVITTRAASLPEVGGDAPFYFDAGDVAGLRAALNAALDPEARAQAVERGLARAKLFDWRASAAAYAERLHAVATEIRDGAWPRPSPVWATMRAEQQRNQAALAALRGPARPGGMRGYLSRSPFRPMLFRARSWLQQRLPPEALPYARRAWRVLMGVRTPR